MSPVGGVFEPMFRPEIRYASGVLKETVDRVGDDFRKLWIVIPDVRARGRRSSVEKI